MNPIVFVLRRPVTTMMLVGALISGGVLASNTMRSEILGTLNTPKIKVYADYIGTRAKQVKGYIVGQYESYFHKHKEEAHHEQHHIMVTSPMTKDVIITQEYVCQIHSQRHIEVEALDSGFLEAIDVREGQAVKKDDLMFKIKPVLYKTKRDAESAEARLAELEYVNTKSLFDSPNKVVSANEVKLFEAKKDRAKAKADQAQAELDFTEIRAAFDGIVDRQRQQLGSFIKEGEVLTTLSDNSVMWVYFNVTEKRYLEYMAETGQDKLSLDVVLMLANHSKFAHTGKIDTAQKIGAIEAQFNNETGNIAFRADFPNPERLLRHGQTGTVLINRMVKGATVIPQRATFENLAKRYVYVVGKDDVVHQREIRIDHELDDIFVIEQGILDVNDRIVFEGIRQVRDGEKVEYEFLPPQEVMANQKNHAE